MVSLWKLATTIPGSTSWSHINAVRGLESNQLGRIDTLDANRNHYAVHAACNRGNYRRDVCGRSSAVSRRFARPCGVVAAQGVSAGSARGSAVRCGPKTKQPPERGAPAAGEVVEVRGVEPLLIIVSN